VRRQASTHAGALCFSRNFRRDRPYFAAVKAETAQRVVIKLAKCVVDSHRLSALPVVRERSACECAGYLDHRDDDPAEGERAMGASSVIRSAREYYSGRVLPKPLTEPARDSRPVGAWCAHCENLRRSFHVRLLRFDVPS
jgi:hypothetical protein